MKYKLLNFQTGEVVAQFPSQKGAREFLTNFGLVINHAPGADLIAPKKTRAYIYKLVRI